MKRSPEHRLFRVFLGAVLLIGGWFFLDNVETIGAAVLGCTYQAAPTRPHGVGACIGISQPKMRVTESFGAVLVLTGIVAATSALGSDSGA